MELANIPPVRTSRSPLGSGVALVRCLLLTALVALSPFPTSPLAAQTPLDARLSIPYSFADPNGLESTGIFLDHALPVTSWSFGICHDPLILTVSNVEPGSAVQSLNGGAGPDFAEFFLEPTGVRSAVIVDATSSGGVLPPGIQQEILAIAYAPFPSTTLPPATTIDFCASLGNPPTPIAVATPLPAPLAMLSPVTESGTVILPGGSPVYVLEIPVAVSTYDLSTGAAKVRVLPTMVETSGTGIPVVGFRCGIRHQTGLFEALNVSLVGPLANLTPGVGLDLFLVDLGPDGVTIEVLIDPVAALLLSFTSEVVLAEIEYEALGGVLTGVGTPVTSPLAFDNTLTSQGVPIVAAVEVGQPGNSVPPILVDGSIVLMPAGEFLRGDCNLDGLINLADPLRTLVHLFTGGSPPCERACDVNDDGSEDLADAITMLGVLFSNEPPPPPPYPTCGLDPTIDGLTCLGTPICP